MNNEDLSFMNYVEFLHQKHELAAETEPFAYDPGKTEFLEQYDGIYSPETGTVTIFTEVKGLRYEERSRHLEAVSVGDDLDLRRDKNNPYNSNNFELFTFAGKTLGSLPAELCNCFAPLYDTGAATVSEVKASYIEQFENRSRYAKQGILFVKITIRLAEQFEYSSRSVQ